MRLPEGIEVNPGKNVPAAGIFAAGEIVDQIPDRLDLGRQSLTWSFSFFRLLSRYLDVSEQPI